MSDLTAAGRMALVAFAALLLVLPFFASGYILSVTIICLYLAYVGQAWNLMLGFAGLLSIGHALFVGLGAYASGYLFTKHGVPPVIGVVAAVAVAVVMGAIIGYLGFRFAIGGVYFALLTIAFSEFMRILIDHAKFLGGTEGMFLPVTQESRRGIDLLNLRGWPQMYYYVILALAAGAFVLCRSFLNGRVGYYWRAIRDNPEAAQAVGVDIFRFRMYAVVLSSGMTGIAGVFYAFYYNNLFPEQVLSIERSIEITLAPIVGGVGTLFGPIFGAFILTPLGEFLTYAVEGLKESGLIAKNVKTDGVKLMFWGLAVALIVLFKPSGLWPWVCRMLGLVKPPEHRG
ncbi:MAG: branched-chain amino acid ABC transporter permease [Alphaproteobacteria bacterium]